MNKVSINGAKVIILSKLRASKMYSSEMIEYLNCVNYQVSRTRVHAIIKELKAAGYVTIDHVDLEPEQKTNTRGQSRVMVCKITKAGCDVITAYLDTEIGASIGDIKERVAATITEEDKLKTVGNVKLLMANLSGLVNEIVKQESDSEQGNVINELEKQQLIAIEKCCIEVLKWVNG